MKKSVLFTTLMIGSFMSPAVFADDSVLKKSCVKENPLVAGETDQTLIGLYAQICDKKNKDSKNTNLIQAAQQFQKIGKNYKALQLVNELNSQNIQHSSLTDVKFLAGIGIANQALEQIRNKEVRYLNETSYEAASNLSEAVNRAKPFSVIETPSAKPQSGNVQEYKSAAQLAREKAAREKAAREKAARERAARERAAREKAEREKATQERGGTPFDPLTKNR